MRPRARAGAWWLAAALTAAAAIGAHAAERPARAPAQPTPPFPTLPPTRPFPTLPPDIPTPAPYTPTPTYTPTRRPTETVEPTPTPFVTITGPIGTPSPTVFLQLEARGFIPYAGQFDVLVAPRSDDPRATR